MPTPDTLLTFFAAALLLSLAPGPDNIFVLTQSALFGPRAGIITTFGLATGLCFHTVAVALGIAALIQASAWAFAFLKLCGAVYLLWLAWLSLRAGASEVNSKESFPGYGALYRRGILMNITNPKVLLFFLAFLPQFCRSDAGPVWLQIVIFGILFIFSALVVFNFIACLGGRLALWLNKNPRSQIIMHRLAALVFFSLAITLAFTDAGVHV